MKNKTWFNHGNNWFLFAPVVIIVASVLFLIQACNQEEQVLQTESFQPNIALRTDDDAWDSIGTVFQKYTYLLLTTNAYQNDSIWLDVNDFADALSLDTSEIMEDVAIVNRNIAIVNTYYPPSESACENCELTDSEKIDEFTYLLSYLDNNATERNIFLENLDGNAYHYARLNSESTGGCAWQYYLCIGGCIATIEIPFWVIACEYLCACSYCTNTPGCNHN